MEINTQSITTIDGPITQVLYFPVVNMLAPLGRDITCQMMAQQESLVPNPDRGFTSIGAVPAGQVVLSGTEVSTLPGFTEFFPALLQAGLLKLNPPAIETPIAPENS